MQYFSVFPKFDMKTEMDELSLFKTQGEYDTRNL